MAEQHANELALLKEIARPTRPTYNLDGEMVVQPVVAETLPGGQGYRVRFLPPWDHWPTGDDEAELCKTLLTGLKLLEMDTLGGSGSRGYGRVQFQLSDANLAEQLAALDPFAHVA